MQNRALLLTVHSEMNIKEAKNATLSQRQIHPSDA
jgi:hypothetical protein